MQRSARTPATPPLRRLAVIGLGKLGLPLAALLAEAGYRVTGIERQASIRRAVRAARAPFYEPGLDDVLRRVRPRLRLSARVADAAACDASLLVVATPSGADGAFGLADLLAAIRSLGAALRSRTRPHLVVVVSTVNPGDFDTHIRPALEAASGRAVGPGGLGLCYNPEFLALGDVLKGYQRPPFVLIGQSHDGAGAQVEALHRRLVHSSPVIHRCAFINAELAKLSVNVFLGLKISFANHLALLCQALPGADVDAVAAVVGSDPRIGPAYLRGGLSFGGPCLPRDQRSLATLARRVGVASPQTAANLAVNRLVDRALVRRVSRLARRGERVAILGLAFKPGTGVTVESPSMALAEALARAGRVVSAYDPHARPDADWSRRTGVTRARTLAAALRGARVVVVATPWPEFRALTAAALRTAAQDAVVVDCWRVLDPARLAPIRHLAWGRGL